MTYDKPFKTLDEQLDILKERGLQIGTRPVAKNLLLTASYYDLVNGYKEVFMPNDKFIPDTSINSLYLFSYIDKTVQAVLIKYSLMLETRFKTCLAHILAKNIGVHIDDYLHQKHYKERPNRNLTFQAVKAEINKQSNPLSAKQPTKHYLKHHNHVPPWILLKNVSLGSAINLFKCLNSANKQEFAHLFISSNKLTTREKIEFITCVMEGVKVFRNCAAHNLNFVKCKVKYDLPGSSLYKLLPKDVLIKHNNTIGKKDREKLRGLYGVILSIYVCLEESVLQAMLAHEFQAVLSPPDEAFDSIYSSYLKIINLPQDIKKKLVHIKNSTQIVINE